MALRPFELVQQNLVLVEGSDDQFVFERLLEALPIKDVQVHAVNSVSNFGPFLRLYLKPEYRDILKTLCLVCDADESREKSLDVLRETLRKAHLPAPVASGEFAPGTPSALIECIPIGPDTGALEDVVLGAIEGRDGTLPCWEDLRGCLQSKLPQAAKFNEARWNKIRLQLVLNCSQRGYKTGITTALESREYADLLTSPAFEPIRALLHKIQAEHRRLQETSAT